MQSCVCVNKESIKEIVIFFGFSWTAKHYYNASFDCVSHFGVYFGSYFSNWIFCLFGHVLLQNQSSGLGLESTRH